MTLAFLALTLIALGALVMLYTRTTRTALVGEANQTLYAAASRTASSLDTFLNNNLNSLRAEAALPEIRSFMALTPEAQASARRNSTILEVLNTLRRKDLFHIESYGLLNRDGINVADTLPHRVGEDESQAAYFRRPLETGVPCIAPVQFAERVGGVYFHFSAPIRNDLGQIVGVLRVQYSVGYLQQLVLETRDLAGPGSFAILLDENYMRLAHSTTPALVFKTVTPLDPEVESELRTSGRLPNVSPAALATDVPALRAGLEGMETQPFFVADAHDGSTPPEQLAVVRLKNQDWYVIFAQSQETFMAPVEQAVRATISWATLIGGSVVFLAFVASDWLTRPVIHLTRVAEQIAAGDLDAEASVRSQDEIGRLAQTFNSMTSRLRETLIGLRETNEQLIQEVAERERAQEERQRLFEAEQRQRLLAETLREVTLALTSPTGLDTVLQEILNQAQRIVPYPSAQIALLEGDTLCPVRRSGPDPYTTAPPLHHGSHTLSQLPFDEAAVQSRTPVLVPDTTREPRWREFEATAWIRSYLVFPICLQERVLGVLRLHSDTPGFFSSQDGQRLLPLVSAAAIALEKAAFVEGLEAEVAARTAQIRAEQEKSTRILDSVADAILMTDEELRVSYLNSAYTRLTGFTASEVLGQPLTSLTSGPEGLWEAIEATLRQRRIWEGELLVPDRDGVHHDTTTTVAPVYATERRQVGYVISHHDVTARKHFERAQRAFLTSVSHELRTPVTTLRLYLQLLRRGADEKKVASYLQNATTVTEQLLQLVQHFLSAAALETEPGVTVWQPIQPGRLVEELIAYRQGRAAQEVAPLRVSPLPPELPELRGDSERLTHALREILDNALTFTPPEGEVRLEVRTVSTSEEKSELAISISDTGPGIEEDERGRVFELFFRGQAALSHTQPGIGLGLPIAKRIVEAHGGRITLESAPGGGSTFTVWLPLT